MLEWNATVVKRKKKWLKLPSTAVCRLAVSTRGSQLLEFAFVLPILAVLAVAVGDFGAGFVLRDKLTNAAREGARIAINQPKTDLTQPNPQTVQGVRDAVVSYLNNSGAPATLSSTNPCATGMFSWTYCLTNGGQIQIERQHVVNVGGTLVLCTRVGISYPYSWTLGRAIRLIAPSSSFGNMLTLSTRSTMKNIT